MAISEALSLLGLPLPEKTFEDRSSLSDEKRAAPHAKLLERRQDRYR